MPSGDKRFKSLLLISACTLIAICLFLWKNKSTSLNSESSQIPISSSDSGKTRSSERNNTSTSEKARQVADEIAYKKKLAEILERNGISKPEIKDIPDEENGLLQLINFLNRVSAELGDSEKKLPMSEELKNLLSAEGEWDESKAEAFVAEHADLIKEFTAIGLLEESSTQGLSDEINLFSTFRMHRDLANLLLISSRLNADSGDSKLAKLQIKAALGSSEHLLNAENGTFINSLVWVARQKQVMELHGEHILPKIELNSNDSTEGPYQIVPYDPKSVLSNTMSGELIDILETIIPFVETDTLHTEKLTPDDTISTPMEIDDKDTLYDAITQGYLSFIQQIESASERGLFEIVLSPNLQVFPKAPDHLSENASYYYKLMASNPIPLSRLIEPYVTQSHHNAALAMMAGKKPPVEPITGKPYIFNTETREFSLPDDPLLEGFESQPIKLP